MSPKTKIGREALQTCSPDVGLLLLDASHKVIYSNADAVRILAYPKRPRRKSALDALLGEYMHFLLPDTESSPQSAPYREFVSGRRRYLCRVIPVSSRTEGVPDATVVVFERIAQPPVLRRARADDSPPPDRK
jgi:hypothetical protein